VRVYEAVAAVLKREGAEAAFVLMAEDVAKLIVELDRLGVAVYSTRHESGAVGMADGYARSSGRFGLAVIGRGPGLTNGMNALITAARARTGMLVVTGASSVVSERDGRAERHPKYVDQAMLLESIRVAHFTLDSAASAAADFEALIDRARNGATIVVTVPEDVADAEAGDEPVRSSISGSDRGELTDLAPIAAVADLLHTEWAARRPLVLAGRGAANAGVLGALSDIGDRAGALMASTLYAQSAFALDPFDIGVIGTFASDTAVELAMSADVVLAFGSSLNPFTTYSGDILKEKTIVQFDRDAAAFGRFLPVDLEVPGDLRETVPALLDELRRRAPTGRRWRTLETATKIAGGKTRSPVPNRSTDGKLDPRWLMAELDEALPKERTVVVDGGNSLAFSIGQLAVPDPHGFLFSLEYFSMGCGQALALGAAVARPDRLTVLAIGDGGAMMTLGELDTAVRYGLPIVAIVVNDSGFGAEMQLLESFGLPIELARFENPSFAEVASALGARGLTLASPDDLASLRDAIATLKGPLVVDCKVTTERPDYQELLDRIRF
jgi:acetolactate synthase-1/2/3 large subunit